MRFYLLGYPVGHSVSPWMHNMAFQMLGMPHSYTSLSVEPAKLEEIIETRIRVEEFGGASVTIPHKITVMNHVDRLDNSALEAGAVNTLQWKDDVLTGYNTDASGFLRALTEGYGGLSDVNAVILGAGGASNAIASKLASKVGKLTILNRTIDKAKALSERVGANYGSITGNQKIIAKADIIINTTPVGMHPNTGVSPINKKHLHSGQLVFDIIYNPLTTQLMLDAQSVGADTIGGLWMLVYQGVDAFRIWTGVNPDSQVMYDVALKALMGELG